MAMIDRTIPQLSTTEQGPLLFAGLFNHLLRICRWLVMYRAQASGPFGHWGPWLCHLGAITPPLVPTGVSLYVRTVLRHT